VWIRRSKYEWNLADAALKARQEVRAGIDKRWENAVTLDVHEYKMDILRRTVQTQAADLAALRRELTFANDRIEQLKNAVVIVSKFQEETK